MKQRLLSGWNAIRVFRLGLGITIIVQSVMAGDLMMGIFGVVFTAMPIFNTGCCGTSGCAVPFNKVKEETKEISYEEVVKK